MARRGHFEHLTLSNVLILHCILYVMFHLNVGDDNDDV